MTLLAPLGLLGLVSIPILILFYLLKVRYRDHEVGSTYLWEQLTRDLAVHEPWQKPRLSILLLIQALLLGVQGILCLSLWGPQPIGWMWVGSQIDYATGSLFLGIVSAFVGMVATLFITVALARRVDHAWMLVRRAAGFEQKNGALERIFIVTAGIAVVGFTFWFLIIAGPGPEIAPKS